MDRKRKEKESKGREEVIFKRGKMEIIFLNRRDQEIPRTEGNEFPAGWIYGTKSMQSLQEDRKKY